MFLFGSGFYTFEPIIKALLWNTSAVLENRSQFKKERSATFTILISVLAKNLFINRAKKKELLP